ncbi:MAG TPA: hypothetical protein DD417_20985 [Elusimicrobia bacterium]|nr:hypothetical protein [Elusimicrobiota bacterium]
MAKRYEMLWDCEYCGVKKLLGLTHRHCPSCGAPQNAEKRYFPPEDEKIAVEDHPFVGADRKCPHCASPSAAAAKCCGQCGAPLDGAAPVKTVSAVPAPAAAPVASVGRKRHPGLWAAAAVAAVALVGGLVATFWTKSAVLTVSGQDWKREIRVEKSAILDKDSWCDAMPGGAFEVSRSRKERSRNRVPDGESCSTRKKDLGDGSYSEEEVCTTKYREEPVYDQWCRYRVRGWVQTRTETSRGLGRSPEPFWPEPSLRTGDCLGCEREGSREEAYGAAFTGSDQALRCEFKEAAKWTPFTPGSRWKADIRVATGGIVCDSLQPAAG